MCKLDSLIDKHPEIFENFRSLSVNLLNEEQIKSFVAINRKLPSLKLSIVRLENLFQSGDYEFHLRGVTSTTELGVSIVDEEEVGECSRICNDNPHMKLT